MKSASLILVLLVLAFSPSSSAQTCCCLTQSGPPCLGGIFVSDCQMVGGTCQGGNGTPQTSAPTDLPTAAQVVPTSPPTVASPPSTAAPLGAGECCCFTRSKRRGTISDGQEQCIPVLRQDCFAVGGRCEDGATEAPTPLPTSQSPTPLPTSQSPTPLPTTTPPTEAPPTAPRPTCCCVPSTGGPCRVIPQDVCDKSTGFCQNAPTTASPTTASPTTAAPTPEGVCCCQPSTGGDCLPNVELSICADGDGTCVASSAPTAAPPTSEEQCCCFPFMAQPGEPCRAGTPLSVCEKAGGMCEVATTSAPTAPATCCCQNINNNQPCIPGILSSLCDKSDIHRCVVETCCCRGDPSDPTGPCLPNTPQDVCTGSAGVCVADTVQPTFAPTTPRPTIDSCCCFHNGIAPEGECLPGVPRTLCDKGMGMCDTECCCFFAFAQTCRAGISASVCTKGGGTCQRAPTSATTLAPTKLPTRLPTRVPTRAPTRLPTAAPTNMPTEAPTAPPTCCCGEPGGICLPETQESLCLISGFTCSPDTCCCISPNPLPGDTCLDVEVASCLISGFVCTTPPEMCCCQLKPQFAQPGDQCIELTVDACNTSPTLNGQYECRVELQLTIQFSLALSPGQCTSVEQNGAANGIIGVLSCTGNTLVVLVAQGQQTTDWVNQIMATNQYAPGFPAVTMATLSAPGTTVPAPMPTASANPTPLPTSTNNPTPPPSANPTSSANPTPPPSSANPTPLPTSKNPTPLPTRGSTGAPTSAAPTPATATCPDQATLTEPCVLSATVVTSKRRDLDARCASGDWAGAAGAIPGPLKTCRITVTYPTNPIPWKFVTATFADGGVGDSMPLSTASGNFYTDGNLESPEAGLLPFVPQTACRTFFTFNEDRAASCAQVPEPVQLNGGSFTGSWFCLPDSLPDPIPQNALLFQASVEQGQGTFPITGRLVLRSNDGSGTPIVSSHDILCE